MTREELIESFKQEAYEELKKNHCRLSKKANVQIQDLITAGVDRMALHDGDNDSQIAEAKRNIRLFCDDMCKRTQNGGIVLVGRRMSDLTHLKLNADLTAGVVRMALKGGDYGIQITESQRNQRLIYADIFKRAPIEGVVLVNKKIPGHGPLIGKRRSGHGSFVGRRMSSHGTLKAKVDLKISNRVFVEARLSICPLWPFC